jgi:diguanylate cyclase (GGDEF)-like protein
LIYYTRRHNLICSKFGVISLMMDIVLLVIVCAALAMSLFAGIITLFRSPSYKKNYFLLMQWMVIVYIVGYLMELTSANAQEAYGAIKVLYLGASFVGTFAFFFAADFCNVKLHAVFVKALMIIISLAITILVWTTRYHNLLFLDHSFETEFVNSFIFTPGPVYPITRAYTTVCMIMAVALLVFQIKKWKGGYRKQLFTILVCLVIPSATDAFFYLSVITGVYSYQFYFTPLSLAIANFFLYREIMQPNVYEIISIATETAMEYIKEGFILVDINNNFLLSNPAATEILPGIFLLMKGEPIFSTLGWPDELRDLGKDNVEFSMGVEITRYFRASIGPVYARNKAQVARIILLAEITDSVNLMKELENAAYIDGLTGLYNRKHFFELANADVERAQRLNQTIYTAMLDLDFFKKVNDTYGHSAGDMVLKTTAGVIRQTIRAYDLLCRYGGEEFALLILDLEANQAFNLVERIRENIESTIINYEGLEIKITCSIGLANFLRTDTLESSIKKSDEALYAAKNSGRNQVKMFGSET